MLCMTRAGAFEQSHLLCSSGCLMLFLPVFVRHPIDISASIVIRHIQSLFACPSAKPFGKTVPAEPSEVHDINVLHIIAFLKMREKLPERI